MTRQCATCIGQTELCGGAPLQAFRMLWIQERLKWTRGSFS